MKKYFLLSESHKYPITTNNRNTAIKSLKKWCKNRRFMMQWLKDPVQRNLQKYKHLMQTGNNSLNDRPVIITVLSATIAKPLN